jgi:two-component system, NtrC family, response regulator PilR
MSHASIQFHSVTSLSRHQRKSAMGSHAATAPRLESAQVTAPEEIESAAARDVPVLVSAFRSSERNTYARLVHARSSRSERPFVELPCEADEHGATALELRHLREGFDRARGGTLFIDDVGTLSAVCQAYLLLRLAESRAPPTRANDDQSPTVRVISGSDGSLTERLSNGTFDAYLFYRLNVIHVDRT